jgi:hypothetical protein
MSAKLLRAVNPELLSNTKEQLAILIEARKALYGEQDVPSYTEVDFDDFIKPRTIEFPSTAQLLTQGGDARIVCETHGRNRYGCSPTPEPDVHAYGSSTASTISTAGFAAADALCRRLKAASSSETPHVTYARELNRVRADLKQLCGLEDLKGLEIIFGASGTDLHLFASQLLVDSSESRPLIVRVEAAETGSGVPNALAGLHFSDCAAFGDAVVPSVPIDCGRKVDILEVKCRTANGDLRSLAAIDAEIESSVIPAAFAGQRILLNLVDVSKTGFLAPSPACVDRLRRRFPDLIEVLVDACQFRLAPSTLQTYLEREFLVAITGSKFITGPTFCGAILVPENASRRLKKRKLPTALKSYSAQADWPQDWTARSALSPLANFGLLLRWEAALTELRAFRHLAEGEVCRFLEYFADVITKRLAANSAFEPLVLPSLDRGPLFPANAWDCNPTIFPFLLRRRTASGQPVYLSPAETKKVHELLSEAGCQVGQPVPCGKREGQPVSALRLCLSSRLIVEALADEGRGAGKVIADAVGLLNQAARLAATAS